MNSRKLMKLYILIILIIIKKYSEILLKYPRTSPEHKDALNCISDLEKNYELWSLNILDKNFSYIKYLYNSGKVYWKQEESGVPLTELQKREHDLFFISKVAALGYSMYRYKEPSKAWAVYCMETELSDLGYHKGGTGKSFSQNLWNMSGRLFLLMVSMKKN